MRKRLYISLHSNSVKTAYTKRKLKILKRQNTTTTKEHTDEDINGYLHEKEWTSPGSQKNEKKGPYHHHSEKKDDENELNDTPVPLCHNIVSTSQIKTSMKEINLSRLASLFPFTSYDRKRFAAITIRPANPHCTCLLFGSGKLVITGSTSFHACLVASQTITEMLREVTPRETFEVVSCVIQNIVAHVELQPQQKINLEGLYSKYCEHSTYQKTIFPSLVLRPPESRIVLLIFKSGRIVCTGGKSYDDIYYGFLNMFKILRNYIYEGHQHNDHFHNSNSVCDMEDNNNDV